MSTKMTQESLTRYFEERGFEVIDRRDELNLPLKDMPDDLAELMKRGVSMSVILLENATLSLQGSAHHYSEPRAFSEEYTSLEMAIIQNGEFVQLEGDDVKGWANFDTILSHAYKINPKVVGEPVCPVRAIRKNAPWTN